MAYMPPVRSISVGMDSVSIRDESALTVRLNTIWLKKSRSHKHWRRVAQDFTARAAPELLLLLFGEVKRRKIHEITSFPPDYSTRAGRGKGETA